MGSHPQETVLHKLLQCESFPQAAALHELLRHGSFPQGAALQKQSAAVWAHKSCQQTCSSVDSSLPMGPQVLPGACCSTASPWGHSLLQASTYSGVRSIPWAAGGYLLHCGPPWAAGEQPTSPWSSSRAAGESLLQYLQYLSSPSFFTDLGACRVVALIFSLLSPAAVAQVFSPPFKTLSQRHYHHC